MPVKSMPPSSDSKQHLPMIDRSPFPLRFLMAFCLFKKGDRQGKAGGGSSTCFAP
ncbi:hypothetical protein FH972_015490 [Carpinus fangiana]|uniref:Uncharacterized protein n=1 Tax=Carpinus fangiana TaxID=176857 RepID=A0A5N6RGD5_9ROSI|nr:hypothetical protein FH972_015490 [Carpinus fangiana]